MRIIRIVMTLASALALIAAAGCADKQPEAPWGENVRSIMHTQRLNPEPTRPLDPVTGLDGRYADQAMDNYVNAPASKHEEQKRVYEPMMKIEAVDE
jgi:acetyl-CoA acetyltransferase